MTRPNHNLQYRSARPEDAGSMALLEAQAHAPRKGRPIPSELSGTYGADAVIERLSHPVSWSRLVFDQDLLIADIYGRPSAANTESGTSTQTICNLMVHPDYWDRHIGSGLLDWAISTLPKLGATSIDLWTESDNKRSRPLYESRGFLATGEERVHPRSKEPQLKYLLDLTLQIS